MLENIIISTYKITGFIFLLFFVQSSFADNANEYLIVRSPNVQGCFDKLDANTCFRVSWGRVVRITKQQAKEQLWRKDKWFKVIAAKRNNSEWWIESKHLVSNADLKEVSEKWPVRYLYHDSGDYRYMFDFKEDGSVEYRRGNGTIKKGKVFIGPEAGYQIMELRYPARQFNKVIEIIGFDPKTLTTPYHCKIYTGDLCAYATTYDKKIPVYDSEGICLVDCPSKDVVRKHQKLYRNLINNNLAGVKDVLNQGVDVNTLIYNRKYEPRGRTLLMIAAENNHAEIVEYLLEKGADSRIRDVTGGDAFYYATRFTFMPRNTAGSMQVVKMLLNEGADVSVATKRGLTPLIRASSIGFVDMVNLLISKKADVNVKTKKGKETALHAAVRKGNITVVEALVNAGADIRITNRKGETPLDLAKKKRKYEIANLLKK